MRAASAMILALVVLMHAGAPMAAPFAYLGRGSGSTIAVVDLQTRTIVANATQPSGGGPYSVAVSRSTGKVFIGNQIGANSVTMFNAATHIAERQFSMGGAVNAVAVTPDGSRVYAAMRDNPNVKAVDVASGTILATIPVGASAFSIAVSPDGSKAFVVNTNSHNISVIDTATNTVVHTIGSRNNPQTIAITPDGNRALVTMWSANQLQFINLSDYSDGHVQVGTQPLGVAVAPNGSRIYVANGGSNSVTVLDGSTLEFITNIGVGTNARPSGISVTADGTAVYVTRLNQNDVVRIDTATNAVTDTIPIGDIVFASGIFTTGPTVPAPPVIAASAAIGQITVTLTASVNDGGHPITGYTINCGAFTHTSATATTVTFTGATNGTQYACSAYATNAMGNSGPSNVVNVRPGEVPSAPTFTSIVPGDGRITAHFDPPAANGGAAITSYRFYCTANNSTNSTSGAGSPLTVNGLTNGVTYQCTVRAFNVIGQGALAPNVAAVPRRAPDAPSLLAANSRDGGALLEFQPPAFNGGAAIDSYIGRCDGGFSASVGAGEREVIVGGLTNGQTYHCRVHATNVAGESSASTSLEVVPADVPDAPTLVSATRGNGSIVLAFIPPASNNGAAVTGYAADCNGIIVGGTESPITVGSLTNGTVYSCGVTAENRIGRSVVSNRLDATPATTPDAPTLTQIDEGDGVLTVHFVESPNDGGSEVTMFVVDCGGETASGFSSPLPVVGLTNGQGYGCAVRAHNAVGASSASNVVNATPRTVPDAPTIQSATPGDGQATISFAAPAFDGGAAISGYLLRCDRGVPDIDGATSPQHVPGLTNGIVYRCAVRARNAAGPGPFSEELSVIPGAASTSADLAITKSNNQSFVGGGLRTGYVIEVSNAGPDAVVGAEVIDELEDYFSNTAWICTANGEARCAAGGQGDLRTLIDLPAGGSVTIVLDAELAPFPEDPVSNVASVSIPAPMTDPNPANNIASDGPDVRGIFRDEFE